MELESKGISKDNLVAATCEEMKNRGLEVITIDEVNKNRLTLFYKVSQF